MIISFATRRGAGGGGGSERRGRSLHDRDLVNAALRARRIDCMHSLSVLVVPCAVVIKLPQLGNVFASLENGQACARRRFGRQAVAIMKQQESVGFDKIRKEGSQIGGVECGRYVGNVDERRALELLLRQHVDIENCDGNDLCAHTLCCSQP
jgi:hypothetical protein